MENNNQKISDISDVAGGDTFWESYYTRIPKENVTMENYIILNGQKVELTDEQAAQICRTFGLKPTQSVKLSDVPVGETFTVGEYEFIVLEHLNLSGGTAVVLKDYYGEYIMFGKTSDFKDSYAKEMCFEFAAEISAIIGGGNLVEHTVDLTTLDGVHNYGSIQSYVSLLTLDRYRRYAEILDKHISYKHKTDKPYCLATPYSTTGHGYPRRICCVLGNGAVDWRDCEDEFGIRPFCVFKSSMTGNK